ncbi:MAG: alpha/beta fold hydrolase [Bacteroidota bacterium]
MKLILTLLSILLIHSLRAQYIVSEDGDSLAIEEGILKVPENRKKSESNEIKIAYQLVRSDINGSDKAIFLLAGGPGGSWLNTAHLNERFAEINIYKKYGNVVLFDQRGAGRSIPNLNCRGIINPIKLDKLSAENLADAKKELSHECRDYWLGEGVDLSGYNTIESVNDMDQLRKELGYESIVLVGGSYGSHLGLAYMKYFPLHVDKAILHGIEGPDHSLDMPCDVFNTMRRIAEETEKAEYYRSKLGGQSLMSVYSDYIDKLDSSNKDAQEELITQFIFQYKAGNRNNLSIWPDNLMALANQKNKFKKNVEEHLKTVSPPHAMNKMMDHASWVSAERLERIQADSCTKYLGDINRHFFDSREIWNSEDLGKAFRSDVNSSSPVLLINGTWDISTPIENAREVNEALPNSRLLEVIHGSHNAYYQLIQEWSEMEDLLLGFLNGQKETVPSSVVLDIEYPMVYSEVQIEFWEAVNKGSIKNAERTLADGAEIDLLDTRKKRTGRTALNWAAWNGDIDMIAFLLENGADINVQNRSGFTPIHHAIENCQVEAFSFLLSKGAETSKSTRKGISPKETAKKECSKIYVLMVNAAE